MGQLQKGPPHHAAMRWQAASLLAGLLLAALLISSGRGGGGAWRDRWLLTVLRLDVGGGGAAAPGARADASSAGTLLAQEQQRVELDLVFVVKGDPEQQKKAAEARQRPQGVSAGRPPLAAPPADAARPRERQLRCAVYNGVQFHSDVAAGLVWAFQAAGCNVSTYLHSEMQGMRRVMEPWFQGQHHSHKQLVRDAAQYDAIVMVTFPEHRFATQLALLLGQHRPPPRQRLLLVSHNPDKLLTGCAVGTQEWLLDLLAERAVRWGPADESQGQLAAGAPAAAAAVGGEGQAAARAAAPAADVGEGRRAAATILSPHIQLLTLAPCVADFTAAMLEAWATARQPSGRGWQPRAEVPWIAPLMPWDARPGRQGGDAAAWQQPRHLCIQGSINPRRRDYAGAFAAAAHPAVLAQLRARNESLLLVGSDTGAELGVPPPLRPHVRILSDLRFKDYYRTLSRCRAILTAFSTDVYIVKKASSTLAAALQVGAPVLTEDSVLASYSYLSPEAAYSYSRPAASGPVPNTAALGAEAGSQVAALSRQEWHTLRIRCKRAADGRRLLVEGQADANESRALSSRPAVDEETGGSEADAPPPGSYAAALLAAFDDDANQAHEAARRAKEQVMQHNVRVAQQLLAS